MRICMVTSVPMPPTEGIGYYVWNLSRFLVKQGNHVQIVTRKQRKRPFCEVLERIRILRPRFYPIYPFHVFLHGLFVRRVVRCIEEEVDIFHIHTPLPPAIRSRKPRLLTIHSMMLADAKARKADSFIGFLKKLQAPIDSLVEKELLGSCEGVTAVSIAAAENANSLLPQNDRCIEVMWNGVDTDFFSPGKQADTEPDHLLFVGRLAPGKGVDDLLDALEMVAAKNSRARLSIAGSGPMWRRIDSRIRRNALDRHVRLLGHIGSRKALRDLYRRSSALVLPSHHESLPTVMLEAMACGTPVIATSVGGVADVIENGINGLLVPPRAPNELATAIERLTSDAGLRERLANAARSGVEERFSWEVVGGRYLRHYQALVDRQAN